MNLQRIRAHLNGDPRARVVAQWVNLDLVQSVEVSHAHDYLPMITMASGRYYVLAAEEGETSTDAMERVALMVANVNPLPTEEPTHASP